MADDGTILSVAQIYAADSAAIATGISGMALMENAGAAVVDAIRRRWSPRRCLVLCGPGNNGGDGFVVARRLQEHGWPVRVALLGARARLRGDAGRAASSWAGEVSSVAARELAGAELVVDALFGAGLDRPLAGEARAVIEALAAAEQPVVAVDVPSGVRGDSGEVAGAAAPADLTVTFARRKPAHVLLPGRALMGELVVADIGIPDAVIAACGVAAHVNAPGRWIELFPRRRPGSHKYDHGHAVVHGGDASHSGAARLAARAALRAGAGLVTVACPAAALPVYAATLTAVMVMPFADSDDFAATIADARRNAVLLGPGGGVGSAMRTHVLHALAAGKHCVLDADALTSFADSRDVLFEALGGDSLLTPHEGEFRRLFDVGGDKLARARDAARRAGAVVLLKGADSVVAAPDGRVLVQDDAPAELATAGTGDVLAGIALGLIAQGMPTFEAAGAAVWLHAAAARRIGPGLIAEDLESALPAVLAELPGRNRGRHDRKQHVRIRGGSPAKGQSDVS